MKKIRIAFIIELYGTEKQGGEQEAMFALATRLRAVDSFDVQIYSYSGADSKKLSLPAPSAVALAPFARDVFAVPRLGRSIVKTILPGVDIVHASASTLFSFARPRIPYVHSVHSIPSERAQELSRASDYRFLPLKTASRCLAFLERRGLSRADAVIALKKETKEFLESRFFLSSEKIARIPNGVDTRIFTPAPKRGKSVLFVGRPTAVKGIDTLLAAAPHIHAPMIIVVPRANEELQKKVKAAGAELHTRIPHDDIPAFYQRAGIFCLPSLKEDQPLTVLEAMASGLPLVVTPSAAADVVCDGAHGMVVPPRDSVALANAVNELVDHPERADAFGRAGRAAVLKDHAWQNILEQHVAIYERLFRSS